MNLRQSLMKASPLGIVVRFVDTGSYILNALVSGSIFGGLPQNKITALAGETSTGKTFFALSIVKNFLDQNPNGEVHTLSLSLPSLRT